MSLLALILLPHLLPDVRSKPDPNRIVYFTQVCVALSDAACLAYITFVPRPSHSSIFFPTSVTSFLHVDTGEGTRVSEQKE